LNPVDDLAWRAMAVARLAAADDAGATDALAHAIKIQRVDPANLLLFARLQARTGHTDEAERAVVEVIQAWPHIVSAPGWEASLPPGSTAEELVARAVRRWRAGEGPPVASREQVLMLTALARGS
jgi:hypothetical protein